jgi:hypothetical protein
MVSSSYLTLFKATQFSEIEGDRTKHVGGPQVETPALGTLTNVSVSVENQNNILIGKWT